MWEGVESLMDTTKESYSYGRDRWKLSDLRAVVTDLAAWDDDADVSLVSVDPAGRRGTVQVSRDED